jgi:elongation factor G
MSELLLYGPDLDSITGGRGGFTAGYSHYDELPGNLAEKVIASFNDDEDEE